MSVYVVRAFVPMRRALLIDATLDARLATIDKTLLTNDLAAALRQLPLLAAADALRGIEGQAAALHFTAFTRQLRPPSATASRWTVATAARPTNVVEDTLAL